MGEYMTGGGAALTGSRGWRDALVSAIPPWSLAAALAPAAPPVEAGGGGWRARLQGVGNPVSEQQGEAAAPTVTPQSAPGGLNTDQGSPKPAQSGDPPATGARGSAWKVPEIVSLSSSRAASGDATKSTRTSLIPAHILSVFSRGDGVSSAASRKLAPGVHNNTLASKVSPSGSQKVAQVTQKQVVTAQKTAIKGADHRPQARPCTTPVHSSAPLGQRGTTLGNRKPQYVPTTVLGDRKAELGSKTGHYGHQQCAPVTQKPIATAQKTSIKGNNYKPEVSSSTTPVNVSAMRGQHAALLDTGKQQFGPSAMPKAHNIGSQTCLFGQQGASYAPQKHATTAQATYVKGGGYQTWVSLSAPPINFNTAMGQRATHLGASNPPYGPTSVPAGYNKTSGSLGSQITFSGHKVAYDVTQKYTVPPQNNCIKRDDSRSGVNPSKTPMVFSGVRGRSATYIDVGKPQHGPTTVYERSTQLRGAERKVDPFSGHNKSRMEALTPTRGPPLKSRSRSKSPLGASHYSSRSSLPKRSERGRCSSSSTSSRSSDSSKSTSSSSSSSSYTLSQRKANKQSADLPLSKEEDSRQSLHLHHRRSSPLTRSSRSPHLSSSRNSSSVKRASGSTRPSHSKSPSPKKKSVQWLDSSVSRSEATLKKASHSAYSSSFRGRSPVRRVSKISRSSRSRSHSLSKRGRWSSRSSSSRSRSPKERDRSSSDSSSGSRSRRSCPSSHKTSSYRRKTSRSPHSRSRMRRTSPSSRSKSSSPGSMDRSSSRSSKSPSTSTHRTASPEKLRSDENVPSRSFGVKIDISALSKDDKLIKDRIYQMFMIYGLVTSVEIFTLSTIKCAVVFFNRPYEQQSALFGAPKTLFNKRLELSLWTAEDEENQRDLQKKEERRNSSRWTDAKAQEGEVTMWNNPMIQFHPRSSRMLLIDDLPKSIAPEKLDTVCARFENILDIDVQESSKKEGCCFALVEFSDIISLINAAKALDRDFFGGFKVVVDFAESPQTNCMWIDGILPSLRWEEMIVVLRQYGVVAKMLRDSLRSRALILYENRGDAVFAVKQFKLRNVFKSWVMVDFASDRSQLAFCRSMEASGQAIGNFLCE